MKRKSMSVLQIISFIIFGVIVIVNSTLSIRSRDGGYGTCLLNLVVICIWIKGFLGSLGVVKVFLSEDEDGVIVYDTPVPFIGVGIVRVVEVVYYIVLRRLSVNWSVLGGLVLVDVLYTVVLLFDKSSYYYVSMREDVK